MVTHAPSTHSLFRSFHLHVSTRPCLGYGPRCSLLRNVFGQCFSLADVTPIGDLVSPSRTTLPPAPPQLCHATCCSGPTFRTRAPFWPPPPSSAALDCDATHPRSLRSAPGPDEEFPALTPMSQQARPRVCRDRTPTKTTTTTATTTITITTTN